MTWYKETADLLRPMYYRLQQIVLQSDYIQVDETTIPVIIKEEHKTRKGYLWLFRSVEDSQVFFHYNNGSRSREVITPLLEKYQGALQTDGYEAYAAYDNHKGIETLGCWAHVRRKFSDSLNSDRERAEYALSQIGLLYTVESKANSDNLTFEERAGMRKRLSEPIIEVFRKWLLGEYPKVLPKSPIGKAIFYACNQYPRLLRYLDNGRYLIDNNMAYHNFFNITTSNTNNTYSEVFIIEVVILFHCQSSYEVFENPNSAERPLFFSDFHFFCIVPVASSSSEVKAFICCPVVICW